MGMTKATACILKGKGILVWQCKSLFKRIVKVLIFAFCCPIDAQQRVQVPRCQSADRTTAAMWEKA